METLPQNAQEITLEGATVPFYTYTQDGVEYLYFDTSKKGHPEPMVNAMTGLQNLGPNQKLVMINHKAPMGLFPKIEADFDYEVTQLENGLYRIVFSRKNDAPGATNFEDKSCEG